MEENKGIFDVTRLNSWLNSLSIKLSLECCKKEVNIIFI
jgi:hypothetical protein